MLEPQAISSDYFSALEIPLLRGRAFNDQDQSGKEKVVIVNESLAQHFFPDQDPIGRRIHDYKDLSGHTRNYYTIVGVVGNTQHDLPETPKTPFQAYYPYAQDLWVQRPINFGTIILKTEMDPRSVIMDFRKAVAAIDPDIPILRISTFNDSIETNFAFRELTTSIVSIFAGIAMLLATVGLYAVISYSVAQRTREIGIRSALGAPSTSIVVMVIRSGLAIACGGLVVGALSCFDSQPFYNQPLVRNFPKRSTDARGRYNCLGNGSVSGLSNPSVEGYQDQPNSGTARMKFHHKDTEDTE